VNGVAEHIEGGVVPLNLSVIYRFSWATAESALRYFFGDGSLELGDDEPLGTALALRPGLDLGSREAFQHFRVLSTFQHEQYHVRHLVGSPFGLALFMLGGRQYAYARAHIQAWGRRIGREGTEPRIPAGTNHGGDHEISDCLKMWHGFQLCQDSLQGSLPDMSLLEATSKVLRPACEEIQDVCSRALGREEGYPDLDVGEMWNHSFDLGALTGRAIVEGLARANEYLNAIILGLPLKLLNRYALLKHHGQYALTASLVEQQLGLKPPDTWWVVARLSDWALQSPLLPFLLRGRGSVMVPELLPSWRFTLLLSRFAKSGIAVDDLMRRQREVAGDLFGGLGWDSPWTVAGHVRAATLPRPASVLTRHYVEGLNLGAEIRESEPDVMSVPMLGDSGHRLQAVYNIFTDRFVQGGTGRFTEDPDAWAIPGLLLSDAVLDSVLTREDLGLPWWIAQRLSEFLSQGTVRPGKLLGKELRQLLGETSALRLSDRVFGGASSRP
jgi:hypothetical protein